MHLPGPLPEHKKVAALFLLPDCDIRCSFCISHDGFDVIDFASAARFLERVAPTSIESVVLGGGEPLLWPHDLGELARRGTELGLTIQVNTHGGGLLCRLGGLEAVGRFVLPLESTDPQIHDSLRRGSAGHHAVVARLVERLMAAEREITFATVVTSRNCAGVAEIADHLGELEGRGARIHAWHLYNFLPRGRGGSRAASLAVPRARFLEACASAKGAGLGFPVYRRDNMLRSSTVEFFWFEGGELCMGGEELATAR